MPHKYLMLVVSRVTLAWDVILFITTTHVLHELLLYCRKLSSKSNTLHINLFIAFILRSIMSFLKESLFVDGLGLEKDLKNVNGVYRFREDGTVSTLYIGKYSPSFIFAPVALVVRGWIYSKTGRIPMFQIISLKTTVSWQIQDRAKLFTNFIRAKITRGESKSVYSISYQGNMCQKSTGMLVNQTLMLMGLKRVHWQISLHYNILFPLRQYECFLEEK